MPNISDKQNINFSFLKYTLVWQTPKYNMSAWDVIVVEINLSKNAKRKACIYSLGLNEECYLKIISYLIKEY